MSVVTVPSTASPIVGGTGSSVLFSQLERPRRIAVQGVALLRRPK